LRSTLTPTILCLLLFYSIDYRTGESLGKVQLPTGVSFSTCSTAAATTYDSLSRAVSLSRSLF